MTRWGRPRRGAAADCIALKFLIDHNTLIEALGRAGMFKHVSDLVPGGEAMRRIAVTLATLLVYRYADQLLTAPGVFFDPSQAALRPDGSRQLGFSIFAAGFWPVFSALVIAEFARLVVPPLARWIAAEPCNRTRADVGIAFMALVLSALQAVDLYAVSRHANGVSVAQGWLEACGFVATLVAGTALVLLFIRLIDVEGVGHGLWVFMIGMVILGMPSHVVSSLELARQNAVSERWQAISAIAWTAIAALMTLACAGRAGRSVRYSLARTHFDYVWTPFVAQGVATLIVFNDLAARLATDLTSAEFAHSALAILYAATVAPLLVGLTALRNRAAAGAHAVEPTAARRIGFVICAAQLAAFLADELWRVIFGFPLWISWSLVFVMIALVLRWRDQARGGSAAARGWPANAAPAAASRA